MTDLLTRGAIRARWGAWCEATVDLPMPSGWRTVELPMRDAPAMSGDAIEAALDAPIAAPPLAELAASKRRAVIAIDDITRPTRTAPLVGSIYRRLLAAGLAREAITVVVATGAHKAASDDDIRAKVGALAGAVRVVSHDPEHGVADTDVTLAKSPVRVNREWLAADLRIGISGIMPHPFAGFSGGGKVVLPGLSDLDAVVRSHKYALMGFGGGLALEGNRFRADMERAVRDIGIDWSVNVVLNSRCETAAFAAGDVVAAHRAAVERAREIGATMPPAAPLDALIVNAYPKDMELLQIEAALVSVRAGMLEWLRPTAPVVLVAACPSGLGTHQLFGPGGRLFRKPAPKAWLGDHPLHIVSAATAAPDARAVFCDRYPYHTSWEACLDGLAAVVPSTALVGFVPSGPLHVPVTTPPGAAPAPASGGLQ